MPTTINDISLVTDSEWNPMLYFVVWKPGVTAFSTVEYYDGVESRWADGHMVTFDGDPLTRSDRQQIGMQLDAWLEANRNLTLAA